MKAGLVRWVRGREHLAEEVERLIAFWGSSPPDKALHGTSLKAPDAERRLRGLDVSSCTVQDLWAALEGYGAESLIPTGALYCDGCGATCGPGLECEDVLVIGGERDSSPEKIELCRSCVGQMIEIGREVA